MQPVRVFTGVFVVRNKNKWITEHALVTKKTFYFLLLKFWVLEANCLEYLNVKFTYDILI